MAIETRDYLKEARKVFDKEIAALEKTRDALDDTYLQILDTITKCQGKLIVTGMGKPGHVAQKLAATFSSLGTPSFCLHPGEAMHGDLGMISENDVVLAMSYSGESDEIIDILPNIKMIGATLIALTANANSTLAKAADIVQVLPHFEEACYMGLAPTSSTTAELCYGDSLAVVASGIYGFTEQDFGKFHPAGALGKKLILKVRDLMANDGNIPSVPVHSTLMEGIAEISRKRLGLVSVVDDEGKVCGVITDGDIRRFVEKRVDLYNTDIDEVMTKTPKTVEADKLAIEALVFMKKANIISLPVVDNDNKLIGTITWQQIVDAGIVL
ncbi:MAG: KpsF/GutQ family sugar-phosphate isomerase [Pseudobutyrivibrio sp.]|nr:KpsF/GutQ family sugar-phosphate isomerase [Pseudobutyrivibrio sp.]